MVAYPVADADNHRAADCDAARDAHLRFVVVGKLEEARVAGSGESTPAARREAGTCDSAGCGEGAQRCQVPLEPLDVDVDHRELAGLSAPPEPKSLLETRVLYNYVRIEGKQHFLIGLKAQTRACSTYAQKFFTHFPTEL